jgi:hypothetical protein
MNWTWDAGQATMQETHIVSGHACGADPTAQPWTLHFERHTILAGKDIDPNGGDVPFTVTPDLSFLAPSAYNDPSSLGSMFGADFFGGSQVQMRITGTTSMSVMVKTHNLMSSYGASTLIPVDNGGSAPLEEDRSCPYVPLP